jgi:hypothetical protein
LKYIFNNSGSRAAKDKVLEAISETKIWDNYVNEISNWLDDKLNNINLMRRI